MRPSDTAMKSKAALQAGFTIIEMMIAMTVSLFIVAALFTVVSGGLATSTSRERASSCRRTAVMQWSRSSAT